MKRIMCLVASAALVLSLSACSTTANSTANNSTSETSAEVSIKTKSDELKEKYDFYEKTVKEIIKRMKVEQGQADDIFTTLVDCGLNQEPTYIIGSNGDYTVDFGKIGEGVTNLYVKIENGVITEVKNGLTVVYPKQPAESESNDEISSSDTSQSDIPKPRETAIGKSDKIIDWFISPKATTVSNDVTGNWRYSGFSESGVDISEYALNYYNEYFEADNEIHAVINFANKTTTRISYSLGMLFVTVFEYTDGEEHDAKIMFSGNVLQDFIIYTDNGDIEQIDNAEISTTESTDVSVPEKSKIELSASSVPEPTQTESSSTTTAPPQTSSTTTLSAPQRKPSVVYIAASGNGTKYHRSPDCSKMNGNVIEMTREEAEAAGYSPCKKNSCYG